LTLTPVLMWSDQSEKTWLWCHSGHISPELGVSLGNSCLVCCYGQQASQWKKLQEGAPALCENFHS
jgi:hypothetical protein